MIKLVSAQIVLVALIVALQCGLEAQAQRDSTKLDNNLQPNVPASEPKRRIIRKFVHITEAPPRVARLTPGTRLTLECPVMGKPAPSVEWLKNGEPLAEFGEESNELITSHASSVARLTSKLVIDSASNGDEFTCVATAGLKRETATTTVYTASDDEDLLTIQKLLFKPSKPVITSYFNEIFQDIGTDLVLTCRVFSNTKSQIFWQDPEDNIVYGNDGRMQVLPSGDLLINGLRWSDMGNFTCVAKNVHGKDSAITFVYPTKPRP